jgi:hypothetical protein
MGKGYREKQIGKLRRVVLVLLKIILHYYIKTILMVEMNDYATFLGGKGSGNRTSNMTFR